MNAAPPSSATLRGFRLSHQQRRRWLLHRERPLGPARCAVEIAGELGGERLRRALADVVERWQILRTAFPRRAGVALPIQAVADAGAPPGWEEIDLSGLAGGEREARFEELWRAAGDEAPDLGSAPALRARCVRWAPGVHRLVLSLPALCADLPTLGLLVDEIAASYERPRGEDEDLVQYVQVSEWQHEMAEDAEEAAEGRAFWQEREAAVVEPLRLPWQREAASGASTPARVEVVLAVATAERLARVAAAAEASLEAALLAAWALLLGRLAGRGDLVVALEAAGRGLEDLAGVLGPLARTLPVRLRWRPEQSFAAAVSAAAAALQDAEDLQPHWTPEPQHDRTAADPGFAFEPWPAPRAAAGLELRLLRREVPEEPRPLALRCTAADGAVTAAIEAAPGLFDSADLARLAEGFHALVEAAAARPESLLEVLPVLPEAERARLLGEFNATASPLPGPLFAHQIFDRQAERFPGREAVRCESGALTYADLRGEANRLAHHLRHLGVGPETVVALLLPRSTEMVVALLAVLKAGGGYLPVDLAQPAGRLARMLEDGRAAVAVTRGGAEVPPLPGLRVVDLDAEAAAIAARPDGDPEAAVDADNLAYVIFTSGSTGRPKGVGVAHRQLASYVHGARERLALEDGVSYATVSTFAADLGNTSVFGALCGGGCLHVIGEERVLDGEALASYLESREVDVLKIVPSHFQTLFRSCSRPARLLPRRCLVLGGEACPPGLVAELARTAPHLAVFNHYGPTETTVGACAHRLDGGEPLPPVPIGRPLANARLYVLDERQEPVPVGVPGELFIGGAGVARGYLGQSAQTAERFLPDPFADAPGCRMYRTGDRARLLAAGAVECLGRLDRQVKIRGFRVEPEEVALALREHPGVEAAVVVPVEDGELGPRLVAYSVPRRAWAVEIDGRRRQALPNGMAIVHQNRNETEYLYQEIFVRHTYAQHGIRLREEAVVFDLGANIGMFTMFVAACRPQARIWACEPLPPLCRTLRLNVELYAPRAKVLPVGVADSERSAEFTFYPQHTMMSSLTAYADPELERRVVERSLRNAQRQGSAEAATLLENAEELLGRRFEGERYDCRLRRLSDILREEVIERIDLLKIDVQRAELDVLRALDDADWERVEQIVMELHQEEGGATAGRIAQVVELLAAHGFDPVVEQDPLLVGTDRYALYASRRDRGTEGESLAALAAAMPAPAARVLDAALLRAWLARRLPEAMCPAQHVLLKALPLTRNGKVNLKALPAPEQARAAGEGYVAPRNAVEEQLAAIWGEVLRAERVGIHDNYFDLGGDSMQSIRVIARAARAGLRLTAQSFFEHQTIARLAAAIGEPAPPAARLAAVSATDFPLAGISQDDLQRIASLMGGVEE
jgi:amino acid adenylation domain-containing protein/FkbM family methyltransferase